jgi:hypothetical protein
MPRHTHLREPSLEFPATWAFRSDDCRPTFDLYHDVRRTDLGLLQLVRRRAIDRENLAQHFGVRPVPERQLFR